MTEVYWIGGIQGVAQEGMDPGEAGSSLFARLLSEKGIRSNWLDELHCCADWEDNSRSNTVWAGQSAVSLPVFTWKHQQLLDHYLVASVSCEIASGKSDLAGIIQRYSGEFACSLLASPRAVGRYNLMPQIRVILSESFVVDDTAWEAVLRGITKALVKAHIDIDQVRVTIFEGDVEIGRDMSFLTDSAEIFQSNRGCIHLLNQLAGLTLETSRTYGMLISMAPNGSGLMTVVERI